MSFADRVQRDLEEYEHDLWTAHEQGEHKEHLDHDCARCAREVRESLNREGDPAFNGAFRA